MPRVSSSIHLTLRIKPELLRAINDAIARANATATTKRVPEPYTLRSWVAVAILEKLGHLGRAKRQRQRNTTRRRVDRAMRQLQRLRHVEVA